VKFSSDTRNLKTMIKELLPKRILKETEGEWLEKFLKTNGCKYYITTKLGRRVEETMLLIYKGSKYNHSCEPSVSSTLANVLLPTKACVKNSNTQRRALTSNFG